MIYLLTVSQGFLVFVEFILCEVHTESQILLSHKLLKLRQGLLSEVSELHHVGNLEFNEVAECLNIGGLETVVSAH